MDSKEFGEYLRKLRTIKGLNISETAKLTGISQPYLSQVERGERKAPSNKMIQKLAEALEADYYELLVKAGLITEEEAQEHKIKLVEAQHDFSNLNGYILNDILLDERSVYYFKHELTEDERQRILNVLKELFPQYYEDRSD